MIDPTLLAQIREAAETGSRVQCSVCGMTKKPHGRSAAMEMANSLCDHECPGYHLDPKPGDLWPGEMRAEFGYGSGKILDVGELGQHVPALLSELDRLRAEAAELWDSNHLERGGCDACRAVDPCECPTNPYRSAT